MPKIQPFHAPENEPGYRFERPVAVNVDGVALRDKRGNLRMFATDTAAVVAAMPKRPRKTGDGR